jgi:phage tail-like protein
MPEIAARNDPFPAFCFELRLSDLAAGGFSEVRGLEIEIEMKDYPEGGANDWPHRLPGKAKSPPLVCRHGLVDRLLFDWCQELVTGTVRFRNGRILLKDQSGRTVAEWTFDRALPSKWSGPELNANDSSVAMESLELVHHGLKRVL